MFLSRFVHLKRRLLPSRCSNERTNDCFSSRVKRELPFIVLRVDSINARHGREESHWLHHSTLINFESKDKSSISSRLSRSIRDVNWHRTSSSSAKKINIQQEEFSFIRTDRPIESIENDMVVFFSSLVNQRFFQYDRIVYRRICTERERGEKRKGNLFFHWTSEIETSERKRIGGKCFFPDEKKKKKKEISSASFRRHYSRAIYQRLWLVRLESVSFTEWYELNSIPIGIWLNIERWFLHRTFSREWRHPYQDGSTNRK